MSEVVSDVTPLATASAESAGAAGHPSDGFQSLAGINDGFLGTGYSSTVELSFVAMALILGYVVYSTTRYFLPEFRLVDTVAGVLGLREH